MRDGSNGCSECSPVGVGCADHVAQSFGQVVSHYGDEEPLRVTERRGQLVNAIRPCDVRIYLSSANHLLIQQLPFIQDLSEELRLLLFGSLLDLGPPWPAK